MRAFHVCGSLALLILSARGSVASSKRESKASDDAALRWGPYRPNLYFGVRPQIPDTLLMGMMWGQGQDKATLIDTLHDTCEQDDGVDGFGWTTYDTRLGGSQTIRDGQGYVDITTDFIKTKDGNSWGVRVTGSLRSGAPQGVKTAVVFHVALEKSQSDDNKKLKCMNGQAVRSDDRAFGAACYGNDPLLGEFELYISGDDDNKVVEGTSVKSMDVPEDEIWKAKSVFTKQALTGSSGGDKYLADDPGLGNMHFMQMIFEGPFTTTFTYRTAAVELLSSNSIQSGIETFRSTFSERVDSVFPRTAPFNDEEHADFSQALLSNLLGGLGFFQGDSRVDETNATAYLETDLGFWEKAADTMKHAKITNTEPHSLLSHVPSRPIFPRGFLWDEGFHLLPVMEWDLDLAVSVIQSWFKLMDDDGWIAREQILGPEARSRVLEEFQVQYPHYANPPTLLLLLPILISKLNSASNYTGHPSQYISSPDRASEMLKELYPLVSRHYRWFRRTQAGNFSSLYRRPEDVIPGAGFRWRGRTPMHTLTSGLDDYPRADPPHPGELHVDALAWVGASARALQQVAQYLGEDNDAAMYGEHLDAARHNLDVIHWDPVESAYCDTTIDTEGEFQRVCHLGYVSLFPLLLGLLDPGSPRLPPVLDLLSDPARLWSPHGLRSLSAADPNYGRDEDYWRGAVWMNLNVLAVLRLRDLGEAEGPERERTRSLAARLRENVVGAVYDSWARTGLFWEQYNNVTGEGQRSRAFTGWTACVILLLGLDLPASEGRPAGHGGVSVVAAALSLASLVLILVFRRGIIDIGKGAVDFCSARYGRRHHEGTYEAVIDLDELDRRDR